ncbi:MAG: PEP-CTERM sorting domain-containing protein [Opitutaceae bacterium]|nr:PEP-CTERM sorting domain-containing protein [Opitutaceae bacterium]
MKTSPTRRLLAALCLLGATGIVHAQLYVYEGFDYTVGSTLPPAEQSGFGWAGGWYNYANTSNTAGSRGIVTAGSLDAPPDMVTTGHHLRRDTVSAAGERVFAEANRINTEHNNVVFFSVLGSVSGNSWSFGLYSDRGRTDNPVVAFSLTGGGATMRLYDAYPYESADGAFTRTIASGVTGTFLWVGRLETSAGNDRLDSWIYTDLAAVPDLMPVLQAIPGPGVVPGSNVNIYDVDALIDRVGYSLAAGSALDEIRIGNDWQSVVMGASAVPEPSTYAAILGALAIIGAVIHRRRNRSGTAA